MRNLQICASHTAGPEPKWSGCNIRRFYYFKLICILFAFGFSTALISTAQASLTTLVSLDGVNGSWPYMALTQGADGNFYGTTYEGGFSANCIFAGGCGTVFKMTAAGKLTTIYNFCSLANCTDGDNPVGSLVQGSDGSFYGTTSGGGTHSGGTVFQVTPAGKLITLYSFCASANCSDGEGPTAGLVQSRNGNFYGTTQLGGNNGGGTVFEITSTGNLITLYRFCAQPACTDGAEPMSGLVQATNGNFYGETLFGGTGFGVIFEITPLGGLTTLFSFNGTDGSAPLGGLIQAVDGGFYGVTTNGGTSGSLECTGGCGTVFKITAGGKLTTLYNFCSSVNCVDGARPYGPLVEGTDGNFYGTTSDFDVNNGTVFEITPRGTLTTLYSFCTLLNCEDGATPTVGLVQATNGTFYGTTSQSGSGGAGTIFSLSTGLGAYLKTQPSSAKEGATVGIFGQGFSGSSVVRFGDVQATNVKIFGTTFLTVKVPAGALSGPVTVTTGGTTLTSNQQFRVTPQVLGFNPPGGSVGTQVTINGIGFQQALGVGFGDNVPALFIVNSDTEVTATVPAGAKTGQIRVVTIGGTGFSSATFTVN